MRVAFAAWLFLLAYGARLTAQVSAPGVDAQATRLLGAVSGTVVDRTGAVIQGAGITVVEAVGRQSVRASGSTNEAGHFLIEQLPPGAYAVEVNATGFAVRRVPFPAVAGQTIDVGSITLAPATSTTVQVTPGPGMAAEQLKAEEQQRLFGTIPNFLVSYRHDAPPLTKRQKYQLTFRLVSDPAAFAIAGVIAGAEQATNGFAGYGQGARGFGRRYGAAYGDFFISDMLASAVLPSLLKQDPRYFVRGVGTARSRAGYAIANAVLRRGDDGRWQPDYSGLLGNLAAGAISNAYYPASSRGAAAVTFENAGIGVAATAAANLLQEFVSRRFTPTARKPGRY